MAGGRDTGADVHARRALSLYQARDWAAARAQAQHAPHHPDCRQVLALLDLAQGRSVQAAAAFAALVADHPQTALFRVHHGNALWRLGDLGAAEAAFRAALERDPGLDHAAASLGLLALTLGDHRQGWDLYRRRAVIERPQPPRHRLPSDLDGATFALHGEQGLGDQLFFLRFAPALIGRGARVLYHPPAKLAGLAARLDGIDTGADAAALAGAGHQAWLGDLPWLLDSLDTPPPLPLAPLPQRLEAVRRRLADFGPPPYVGVTWRAGLDQPGHLFKALSPHGLGEFLTALPARVILLQRQPQPQELAAFQAGLGRPALDLSMLNDDLEDMLALLSLLDDVIAVSNTNLHLLAALGRPARVLLPFPAEFRWRHQGATSPWFPGFALYRQQPGGDWNPALAALAADLGLPRPAAALDQAAAAARDGRWTDAAALASAFLDATPDHSAALRLLSMAWLRLGRVAEAVPVLARLAEQLPSAENLRFHASALLATGAAEQAALVLDRAAILAPGDGAVAELRASVLLEANRSDEALAAARALPASPKAKLIEGNALLRLGRFAEAASVLQDLPDHSGARNSLAQARHALGDSQGAERDWRAAIALDGANAAARGALGLLLLGQGRFAEGWDLVRWRSTAHGRPGLPQDRLPARLDGLHVLLRGEQGLGDELFLLRFAPQLARRGARITYAAHPKLAPLLADLPFLDRVICQTADIAADLTLWLGDLPWLLDCPGPLPSLRLAADPERAALLSARLAAFGPPPYVGLTWRAGTLGFNRLSKDVPLTALAQALKGSDFRPVIVQRHPAAGEVATLETVLGRPALDLSELNDDLPAMTALLSLLDDTVAVSNTNIHLLAALGKPAHLLLPRPPEYRWMLTGERSPWFPDHALFRQGADGDWKPALRALGATFQGHIAGRKGLCTPDLLRYTAEPCHGAGKTGKNGSTKPP